ncbi:MAG TPA: AAA family ATPase, partial [Steroidobacteraceae bacterium]|nr:AAA family ATPase [Steroidobacteraceae bacterium]
MYLAFFGIAEKPFAITPDPRYLYLGRHHADALAHLVYGINDAGGFIQLTGEVGTGKTTTIRSLLARAPKNAEIALVINPRLSPLDFLQTICEELGVGVPDDAVDSAKELVDQLNRYLLRAHAAGRRVVLIIDEAQNLSVEVLEQVRLLTNLETASQKLLQIILIGQPELRELLGRNDLRQLAQRVTARFHLQPLAREETIAYVRHRLRIAGSTSEIFSGAALREVHRLSGGVPRVINIICDRALLGAYTEDHHHISSALVRRAASEIFGERLAPVWLTPLIATLCLLVAVTVGTVLWRQASNARVAVAAASAAQHAASAAAHPAALPHPPQPPTLAQLFATAGDSTSADTAFAGLFQLWNAKYVAGPTDPCTQAETQGLYCVTLHSSLAQLREFARPAILMLGEGGAASHQVVLTGIGPDGVVLQMGARTVRVAIADLSLYWFGDCVLLWQPATPPVPELRPGMRGPAIRSLRMQLLRANGASAGGVQSATYDPELLH